MSTEPSDSNIHESEQKNAPKSGHVIMSVTYFCPSCWSEVGTATICPNCGADLQDFSSRSYEEKLIIALRHPEPTVPIRAATILGELGSQAAVEPLIEVATSVDDPYIQEAAVVALGRIGDIQALACLDNLSREGAVRVRAVAERALKNLRDREDATKG
jgi:hypothetical protein